MGVFDVLQMLGGLALFLFGMQIMGQGLEKLSGGKLEKILEKFTNNRFKGVILGALVTAMIQSSSATTVMVVGFVNSGIMKLSQTVGIIMGANIGTTITAWIISLTGITSENIFMQMLKPEHFSLIFAVIGAIFFVFVKSGRKPDIGQIFLGFAVLIYGMKMMSGSVDGLNGNPAFMQLLVLFKNPLFGVLVGAVVTGIIQSSAASIGMLQALSIQNPITFAAAFPIILGQNIGTCATALLSCIGASKNAKRAAIIHLYFNFLGTALFLIVMYLLNSIVQFSFWNETVNAAGIAATHTVFNIFCTAVFIPFTKMFEKLAFLTIRDSAEENKKHEEDKEKGFLLLDERFLQSPSFALGQCKNAILKMAVIAQKNVLTSFGLIWNFNENTAKSITENEEKIDVLEDKLSDYLIKLTDKDLSLQESRNVSKYLHSISDFERIGDHAENIMEVAEYIRKNEVKFSPQAITEINVISAAIADIMDMAINVFDSDDAIMAANVEPLEEVVDLIRDTLKTRHVERLKKGGCTVDSGVVFNDLLSNFERISDHCSNIALYVIELKDEKYESHQYMHRVRDGGEKSFTQKYDEYKAKYYNEI